MLRNAIDGRKLVWKSTKKQLDNNKFESLLDNFLDKMFHCNSEGVNLAVENLNSIFDLSASLSNLNNSSRQPKKINNIDKWFDEECKNLRNKLRNVSNQKHRAQKTRAYAFTMVNH